MHSGISNVDHTISDLGQDLRHINVELPSIWELIAKEEFNVGVFGSLQSYPILACLDNYEFYVPDTFANGNECHPSLLSDFQTFNLSMVKANGRSVSSRILMTEAKRFLRRSIELGRTSLIAKKPARSISK